MKNLNRYNSGNRMDIKDFWAPLALLFTGLASVFSLGGSRQQIRQNKADIESMKQKMVTKEEIHDKITIINMRLAAYNRMTVHQIKQQQLNHAQYLQEFKEFKQEFKDLKDEIEK